MTTLGDRLREARKEAKLSQKALAKRVGVSQPVISELESGENATSKEIVEIAAVLGVEPLWLAKGKGSKRNSGTAMIIDHGVPSDVLALAKKLLLIPEDKLKAVSLLLGIKL